MLKIIRAMILDFDDIIKIEDFDLNRIQDGWRGERDKEAPLYQFFPCNFYKRGI